MKRKFNKLFRYGLVCKVCGELDTAYTGEKSAKKGAAVHAALYCGLGESDHMVVVFDGLERSKKEKIEKQMMLDL